MCLKGLYVNTTITTFIYIFYFRFTDIFNSSTALSRRVIRNVDLQLRDMYGEEYIKMLKTNEKYINVELYIDYKTDLKCISGFFEKFGKQIEFLCLTTHQIYRINAGINSCVNLTHLRLETQYCDFTPMHLEKLDTLEIYGNLARPSTVIRAPNLRQLIYIYSDFFDDNYKELSNFLVLLPHLKILKLVKMGLDSKDETQFPFVLDELYITCMRKYFTRAILPQAPTLKSLKLDLYNRAYDTVERDFLTALRDVEWLYLTRFDVYNLPILQNLKFLRIEGIEFKASQLPSLPNLVTLESYYKYNHCSMDFMLSALPKIEEYQTNNFCYVNPLPPSLKKLSIVVKNEPFFVVKFQPVIEKILNDCPEYIIVIICTDMESFRRLQPMHMELRNKMKIQLKYENIQMAD